MIETEARSEEQSESETVVRSLEWLTGFSCVIFSPRGFSSYIANIINAFIVKLLK